MQEKFSIYKFLNNWGTLCDIKEEAAKARSQKKVLEILKTKMLDYRDDEPIQVRIDRDNLKDIYLSKKSILFIIDQEIAACNLRFNEPEIELNRILELIIR